MDTCEVLFENWQLKKVQYFQKEVIKLKNFQCQFGVDYFELLQEGITVVTAPMRNQLKLSGPNKDPWRY